MDSPEPLALWMGQESDSPVVAVAVHAGHRLRDEVAALAALDGPDRFREEDPYTDRWTTLAPTRLVACRSRFEFDLNRPRDGAVYREPGDAWGLQVWHRPLPPEVVARSLAGYDACYDVLARMLDRAERVCGRFVLYDLHSYNHRRDGPDRPPAVAAENPDINVGTASLDRERWGGVVDRLMAELRTAKIPPSDGREPLDVRENVRFGGGYLARWVHERYPRTGCALAIEVKKFFMDEHTGEVDEPVLAAVGDALAATVPAVVEELGRVKP